jgi:hypothetical protein
MPSYETTVYKYLSQRGCQLTLENGSLRFSRPSALNDPFDLYLDDLYNTGVAEVLKAQRATLFKTLETDPERYAALTETDVGRAKTVSRMLQSIPERERELTRALIEESVQADPLLNNLVDEMSEQRKGIVKSFENTAVFCASKSHDNLLMWAHYADQHRGAVLGFRPDIETDSILRLLEPVRYSDVRPLFYELTESWGVDRQPTLVSAFEINKTLMLTKSSHWKYENEVRIVIPNEVPAGQDAIYLKFKPHELTEIYLGCRADEKFAKQSVVAAQSLNPNISVNQSVLKPRTFELSFQRLG